MSPSLRLLTAGRAGDAAALHALCFADPWSAASIEGLVSAPNVLALAFEDEAALVAFAIFQSAAGDVELLTIATMPDRQGEGLAGHLIEAAILALAGAGNTRINLEVAEDNAPARSLYRRLGFVADGRRAKYYKSGRDVPVDAILMSLRLTI